MNILAKWICILAVTAPIALQGARAADDAEEYSRADLDQMLAPVALYPDTVLSHLLIASTYPLEVVQAARWSRQHAGVKGTEAVDAVEDKDWDPSVKALAAFPEILARMDENLEWTQELGEAFLAQEGQVMDSVQGLRKRAYANGGLNSLEHVRVIREREVIYIEPALSHLIFVPYYNPWVIYGSWWWPSYPPYSWTYWDGHPVRHYNSGYGSGYSSGFYWGSGFHVSPVFYFSSFNWHHRHVVVLPVRRHSDSYWTHSSREIVRHNDAYRWQHDSRHRRGVAYSSERLSRDYSGDRRDSHNRERDVSRRNADADRGRSQRPHAGENRTENRPDESGRHNRRRDEASHQDDRRSGGSRADSSRGEAEHGRNHQRRADQGSDSVTPGNKPREGRRSSKDDVNDSRDSSRSAPSNRMSGKPRDGSESRGRSGKNDGEGGQGASRGRRDSQR